MRMGFGCPHCGCKMVDKDHSVQRTMPTATVIIDGKPTEVIRRYRKCRNCQLSYRTTEVKDPVDREAAPPLAASYIDPPQRNEPPANGPPTIPPTNPFI